MSQFDVYENTNSETKDDVPLLLDVQSDLLEPLATRVVVPLIRVSAMPKPARTLNPVFEVAQRTVVMSTAELAGVPRSVLGDRVSSLARNRDKIVRALDFLLSSV